MAINILSMFSNTRNNQIYELSIYFYLKQLLNFGHLTFPPLSCLHVRFLQQKGENENSHKCLNPDKISHPSEEN